MTGRLAAAVGSDDTVVIEGRGTPPNPISHPSRRYPMQWTAPQATDLRFGFEITMYISAR